MTFDPPTQMWMIVYRGSVRYFGSYKQFRKAIGKYKDNVLAQKAMYVYYTQVPSASGWNLLPFSEWYKEVSHYSS